MARGSPPDFFHGKFVRPMALLAKAVIHLRRRRRRRFPYPVPDVGTRMRCPCGCRDIETRPNWPDNLGVITRHTDARTDLADTHWPDASCRCTVVTITTRRGGYE